jgi:cell wall-associated NlpC family hydrolase
MKIFRLLPFLIAMLSMASAHAAKVVLGKLGQALEGTPIYSNTSTRAKVYYRVQAYEYLVIKPTRYSAWMAVLLQNGSYGYVPAEKVCQLPYEVTTDKPVVASRVSSPPSRSLSALADYSLNYLGTPYKWGGTNMEAGVDCSGFVKGLFGQIGVALPRTAAEQVRVGQPIHRLEDLQPGDRLYFWSSKRNKVGHTGMYLGRGYFVHASSSNGKVVTDYLGKKHWLDILVAARR